MRHVSAHALNPECQVVYQMPPHDIHSNTPASSIPVRPPASCLLGITPSAPALSPTAGINLAAFLCRLR
jgi:hypothetical protein